MTGDMGSLPNVLPWSAGDVIIEENPGWLSRVIRLGTLGPSHVAVVARLAAAVFETHDTRVTDFRALMPHGYEGRCVLWESDCQPSQPCLFLRRKVEGVQCHPLESLDEVPRLWRLPIRGILSNRESLALTRELLRRTGERYDALGAALAGTHWLKRLFWWRCADRSTQFCSELVGSVLEGAIGQRMGFPHGLNWGQFNPRQLVHRLRRSGLFGDLQRIR